LCKAPVISHNPAKLRALEEAGLEIIERVSIEMPACEAARYLQTKKRKGGTPCWNLTVGESAGAPVIPKINGPSGRNSFADS
jgi:hypothetical protein